MNLYNNKAHNTLKLMLLRQNFETNCILQYIIVNIAQVAISMKFTEKVKGKKSEENCSK